MKLACFGAGTKSECVKDIIEKYTDNSIGYYVEDQEVSKIGSILSGKKVLSLYQIADEYLQGGIQGIVITTEYHKNTVQEMIEACKNVGIADEDIYLVPINIIRKGYAKEKESVIVPYNKCVQIYNIDIHLVDHCNMNCELCCHQSQLVEGEVFLNLQEFEKDLKRLKELVPNICQLSLLGGEPLLHPQLNSFLKCAREEYPYSNITIATNGILLRSISQESINCMKDNNICLSISLYPPMHTQLDSLLEFVRKSKLKANIRRVDKFFKKFCDTPFYDPKEMSSYCGYCMGLRHGKMSRCIDSLYVKYFNDYFGNILPEEKGIDIYNSELTGLKLVHMLEEPLELCAYCASKYTLVDLYSWKKIGLNPVKEDILYKCREKELKKK